jgi:hypothetical protein
VNQDSSIAWMCILIQPINDKFIPHHISSLVEHVFPFSHMAKNVFQIKPYVGNFVLRIQFSLNPFGANAFGS